MLHEALKYIEAEVNNYFSLKLGPTTDPRLVQGNIAQLQDNTSPKFTNKIILSLINIEEDRLSKRPDNISVVPFQKAVYKNPKMYINMYLLFAVNKDKDYTDAIRDISLIIQCFQRKNIFTIGNSPLLPQGLDRIIMELLTLSFEQLNHMWGVLGGKYYPSVLYKLKAVGIEDDHVDFEGGLIKEIDINAIKIDVL